MPKPDAFPPHWWRYEPGHGIATSLTLAALAFATVDAIETGPWWKAGLYGLAASLTARSFGTWVGQAILHHRSGRLRCAECGRAFLPSETWPIPGTPSFDPQERTDTPPRLLCASCSQQAAAEEMQHRA